MHIFLPKLTCNRFAPGRQLVAVFMAIILFLTNGYAQPASVVWPLTADDDPVTTGNVNAGILGAGSVGPISFGLNGAGADTWTIGPAPEDWKYFLFTASPSAGNNLLITGISLETSTDGTSGDALIQYSLDPSFASPTTLGSSFTIPTTGPAITGFTGLSITVSNNQSIYFRVHAWNISSFANVFTVRNFTINGNTVLCLPDVSDFSTLIPPAVCEGSPVNVTVNSSSLITDNYTVTYDLSGANAATGLTASLSFTAGVPGSGTFTIPAASLAGTGNTTVTITGITSSTSCTSNISSGNSVVAAVTALPAATFSYTASPYCASAVNPLPTFSGGAVAGVFSSTPGLVFVNTATGEIDLAASTPATYTVTNTIAAADGCGVVTANSDVTITADNTITLTSTAGTEAQSVCINTAITNITYLTTGATGASFSGLPTGVTGNWTADVVTISGTPTASGVFNYAVTLTGGCGNITASGSITSAPNNTITLSSAAGTDAQSVCINTAIANITYSTTGATGATFSGLPAGVSGNWAGNVITITGTPTASGTFNYTVTTTGGCTTPVVAASGTITVAPNNTITLSSGAGTNNQTRCINVGINTITFNTTGATGATFSGLPAGVTGSWTADVVTISGTPTASGTFNYTVTTTGGCTTPAITATGTISVTANNTITRTSAAGTDAQTSCINVAITTITYSTTGATGATFSGLPAGVTGNWAGNVATISGTPTGSGTFNYTVTTTGGCTTPAVTATGTITVTPNNTINLTSAGGTATQTRCINTAITDITYSTTVATGATFSGLPAGVTGNWAGNTITISGIPTSSGVFNYTVTLTGGCGITGGTGSITVYDYPAAAGVSICQNGSGSLTSSAACAAAVPGTAGPSFAGSGATSGGAGTSWTNTTRITANDNSYTGTSNNLDNGDNSEGLNATNFGFAIPANAVITGVQVTIGRYASTANTIRDDYVRLLVGGTLTGANRASAAGWPNAEAAANYGSASDLWGTTLTPAQVNLANFGVSLAVEAYSGNNRDPFVDYIQMTISYTVPGSLNWYTVSSGGSVIGSNSPFNPVGVAGSGLANTATAGTTVYYAECAAAPGCRTAANFVINALPTITGNTTVCIGLTSALTGNGTPAAVSPWTSSNTGVATVNSTGVVTGVSAGTSTITYTNNNNCSITTIVTVSAPAISGTLNVCVGSTRTLTGNGTPAASNPWVSSNTAVATINSSGVVTGIAPGTTNITFTNNNGCFTTSLFTVNALPVVSITGANSICAGGPNNTTTLSPTTGGTWASSNNSIATVTNAGAVTGITAGTVTFSFTQTSTGCSSTTASVTVTARPTATFTTTPGANVCVNTNVTYTTQAGQSAYIWTIPGTAGINYTIISGGTSSNNTVTLQWLTSGSKTVTVNYSNANGCTSASAASNTNTANARPTPTFTASPGAAVCAGSNVTYTTQSGQSSYVWTVPGTAGVDYTIISGGTGTGSNTVTLQWLTAGSKNVTVNYNNGSGCTGLSAASNITTVNARPIANAITGLTSVCVGSTITLTSNATGTPSLSYTWNSSNGNATVTNAGVVTGVSAGTSNITYTVTDGNSCTAISAAYAITIFARPAPTISIAPSGTICASVNITYTTQPGMTNYTWTIPGTAGVDYTIVSGGNNTDNTVTLQWLTTGSKNVTINYTNANGCTAATAGTSSTTVNARPIPTFTASPGAAVCASAGVNTTDVTYTTQSGQSNYTWNVPGAAGVDYTIVAGGTGAGSNTVTLRWLTTGSKTVTVNYNNSNGCTALSAVSNTTTVNALPVVNTSATSVCINSTINAAPNSAGTWVSSDNGIAAIDNAGVITGVAAGSATFTYTLTATGCSRTTAAVTVNPLPFISPITGGASSICVNDIAIFSNATAGGSWSIVNGTGTANVDASGLVTGLSAGTVSVVYTYSNGTCTNSVTAPLTINAIPAVGPVGGGAPSVCVNAITPAFTNATAGGVWSIIDGTGSATVNGSGVVTGVTAGTVTVVYTVDNGTCSNESAVSLTVNPQPAVASIGGGAPDVCVNSSTPAFANATAGGTWSIINGTGTATITAGGVVTGVSAGTVTVAYTVSNGICSNTATQSLTVNPLPVMGAIGGGAGAVCMNANTPAFTNSTPGGVWSIINGTGTASITAGGIVTGLTTGNVTVVYTVTTGNGCTAFVTAAVTVNSLPVANVITGVNTVCSGSTINLTSNSTGTPTLTYTWASDNGNTSVTNAGVVTGISAGTSDITYTVTNGDNCSATSPAFTVTVNARPTATITSASTTICDGTAVNITGNVIATGAWTLLLSNGATASGTGNGTFSITESPAATTTYTITSLSDINCSSIAADLTGSTTVTVNTPVTITAEPADTVAVCATFPATFTVSATGSGLTYQWYKGTFPGTPVTNNANISGATTASLHFNQANVSDVDDYYVVVSGLAPCAAVQSAYARLSVDQTITITQQPVAQTVCTGSDAQFVVVASAGPDPLVYQWRKGGVDIPGANTDTLNIIGATAADAGNYRVVITGIAGCVTSLSNIVSLTVNPPSVGGTVNSDATVCIGANSGTLTLTGHTGNIVRWESSTDGGGTWTPIANTTAVQTYNNLSVVTMYRAVVKSGVCAEDNSAAATISFYPVPDVIPAPSSQTVCSGTAITTIALSGSVPSTTYTWTRNNNATVTGIAVAGSGDISGTLTNTTLSPVTVTFTITPHANGCTGTPVAVTVTVDPSPDALATPASQVICSGNNITNIVLSSTVPLTSYTWTRNNTGTVTGIAASGSGDITGALTNITSSPVTVTFTVTPTAAGCTGGNISATVTVDPLPNAIATPSSQTVCSGAAITTIALTSAVSGTTYSWTRDNTASVTGIAASGNGNISGSLTNTTLSPVTVTFTITPSANGCPGTPITATVTVDPAPDAFATPSSQSICSGASITTIALSSSLASTYTWTRNNTVSVTGIAASGSGNISGSLTNTSSSPVTVTFTITPTAAGCPGAPITATVVVNPTPNAVATPASQTICSGPIGNIVLSGNVSGTTYNWTRNNTGTVTGIAASGSGDIAGSLTNTTNALVTVTFTTTPTANGCPGAAITATVGVRPTPTVSVTNNSQTVCGSVAIASMVISNPNSVAGTAFSWTRDNVVNLTGIAASGTGTPISGTFTNNTSTQQVATFTVTATANTCSSSATATVTVNPRPVMTSANAQTVCNNSAVNIPLTSNIAANYTWVAANNTNVSGESTSTQTTNTINNILVNTSASPGGGPISLTPRQNVTYTVTPTASGTGCLGIAQTVTVTVNPSYNISYYEYPTDENLFTICDGDLVGGGGQNDMDLIEGQYSGATLVWQYSVGNTAGPWNPVPGPYVNGAIHDTLPPAPSVFSPMGNYYFRLSVDGCFSDTISMTKTSTLTIEAGTDKTTCQSGSPSAITLSGSTVGGTASTTVGGTWSIYSLVPANGGVNGTLSSTAFRTVPNIPTVTYTPPAFYTGVVTLWLTSNDPDGNGPCGPLVDSVKVFVSQAPIVANASVMAICSGENTGITLTSVIPSTYTWTVGTITGGITGASAGSGNNINQVLNNPSTATAGTVQYVITPAPISPAACPAVTSNITVTVRPLPAPSLSRSPATVCSGSASVLTATNTGGTLSTTLTGNNNTVYGISSSGNPTVTSTIALPAGTITAASAITLSMNLSHTWAGDLRVTLISPGCGSTILFNRPGGTNNNNDLSGTYTFVSSGGAAFPANTNPVTAQTYNATFTGIGFPCNSPAGNWTLQIEDLANGDGGALNYWSLSINATGTYTSVFNGAPSIGAVSYAGAGNTTATASVTPPVGVNNYTVTTTDAAGCAATSSAVSVTVNPPPTLTGATQAASVCAGSSAQINLVGLAAGTTSTITYRINAGATQTVTGVVADAGGNASFNSIALTAANNGQILQITSVTTTSASPACAVLITQNVTLSVNATPTLTGASQQATVCPGSPAQINMTGLVPNTIITATYTINGGPVVTVTNIPVSAGGAANFTTTGLTIANNGQILQITGVTITSALPNCSQTFTRNVTLAVHPNAILSSSLSPGAICSGSAFSYIPSSATPGSSFTWSRAVVAGISQPAASGSGNINEILTNTTSSPVTVTFAVTTSANGCNNAPGESVVLVVNPAPSLSTVSQAAAVCAGTGGTINLTGLIPGSTSTIFYSINGVSQPSVAGVVSNGSGNASFTSANLALANNGQVLRVTGVSTTSNSPTCARTFSVITLLSVNALPTLSGASQASPVCVSGPATINVTGLLANSTNSTINYTINGVAQPPATGVNANGSGAAGFNTGVLTAANNGQILQITGITNGICTQSFTQNVTLAVGTVNTWLGVNTNWFDPSNWCAGVPSSATDVLIPGSLSFYPVINSGVPTVRNITIQNTASVILNGAKMQVAGAITNTGIFNATAGAVELNGNSGVQTLSGSVFANRTVDGLIISNPSGVNISAAANDTLNIADSLAFGNVNNTVLNTGDNITLLSRAAKTARVANITNGGANTGNSFTGKVIIERFIPQRRAWRMLTVPLQQAGSQTFNAAWQEGVVNPDFVYANRLDPHPGFGTLITGPAGSNGFDPSPMNNYSVQQFNPLTLTWGGIPNTHTAKVTDSAGYMVFVRGNRATQIQLNTLAPVSNTILRSSGFLKTDLQTTSIPAGVGPFSLAGNPYASSIDLRQLSTTGGVSGANYIVWDPSLTGSNGVGAYQYLTRSGGPGSDYLVFPGNSALGGGSYGAALSVNNTIQSSQAFFVQNTGAGSVSINENAKTAPNTSTVFRPATPVRPSFGYISTLLMYENGSSDSLQLVDGALMMYDGAFSDNIDLDDARKIQNFASENFGISSNDAWLQIEKRNQVGYMDTIFFKARSYRIRDYQLHVEAANINQPGLSAFLEDNYLHTSTPVSLDGSTVYRFTVTADSGAWRPDRFRIVFRQVIVLPVTFTSVKAYRVDDDIKVEWKTENESSVLYYEIQRSADGIHFEKAGTEDNVSNNGRGASYKWPDRNPVKGYNYYRIKCTDADGTSRYTNVVKVWYDITSPLITLYPNPVADGIFNLYFVNLQSGEYRLRLFNSAGQLVEAAVIKHAQTAVKEVFKPKQQLLRGNYIIEVTKPDGTKQTISAMY